MAQLTQHLSLENRQLLASPQMKPVVKRYHHALQGVKRGQDKQFGGLNKFMHQTDWEHTIDMKDMLHEINNSPKYGAITASLDLPEIEREIFVHDVGEPHKKTGDVPIFGPERDSIEGRRRKRNEPRIGYAYLGLIPDPQIRGLARAAYRRVWKRDPRDPEAQLTQILDKIEGTTRGGLVGIFGRYRSFGFTTPPQILIDHISTTLRRSVIPFCYLAPSLTNEGRKALFDYMQDELSRLEEAGYEEPVANVREIFGSVVRYSRSFPYCDAIVKLALAS